MSLEVEATYENGILKPDQPLPLNPNQRVRIAVYPLSSSRGYGLLSWSGTLEDLDYLINAEENDPLEAG